MGRVHGGGKRKKTEVELVSLPTSLPPSLPLISATDSCHHFQHRQNRDLRNTHGLLHSTGPARTRLCSLLIGPANPPVWLPSQCIMPCYINSVFVAFLWLHLVSWSAILWFNLTKKQLTGTTNKYEYGG